MALIGKIRRNFWFVLILLGLALAAFIIMDMVNAGNRGGLGPQQVVGEVAGQKIDYQDFQKVEQALYSNSQDNYAAKNSVWNYLVERAIIDKQADALGVGVSRDELIDLQFGSNLSPVIQNTFRNPQTGQVDMQQLLNIKQAIESGDDLSPTFRLSWAEQEKQIKKIAKQDKITNLVSKAMYTPSYVAETSGKQSGTRASFDYVKIPFDQVNDSEVQLTDSDINAYIADNKAQFDNDEETRTISYVVKKVVPTAADSAKWRSQVENIATEFRKKSGDQDSLYTINNQGVYSPFYSNKDDLFGSLKGEASSMAIGDVYGPFEDQGAYFAAKLIDKKVLPDSVTARHILRSVANGDPAQLAAATAYIDSVKTLITTGASTMEELAPSNSQDPGSAFKGGDLGTFGQGTMVPAFNNACFIDSKDGGLYTVTTRFGVHLIQVEKRKFNNRDPKYKYAFIRVPITPTQETQDAVEDQMAEIIDSARDIDALAKAIDNDSSLSLETAPAVKANDYAFASFGSGNTSRDIIKWAYDIDTKVGEVSPTVYAYTDPVNYFNDKYVVAALKRITPPGIPTAAAIKDEVSIAATNWKKGKILADKISGSDLNAIASQFGSTVTSAPDIAFNNTSAAGIGYEPKVMAAAFGLADGQVSAPIRGNNGVYVVKTTSKTDGVAPNNIPTTRKTMINSNRSRAPFSLMSSLKKLFDVKDNRSTFF